MGRTRYWIVAGVALALLATLYFMPFGEEEQDAAVYIQPKTEQFAVSVKATGELKARNSVKIRAPQNMRSAGIFNTNISDIIPEGTLVSKGDYVATLDRTEIANKMKEVQTEIDKVNTQLEQARIDTAIELRSLRDEITNLRFALEEKKLQVEQSQYEPQMVVRQAELDYERTERDLDQLLVKYELKIEQSRAKISEITTTLIQAKNKRDRYQDLAEAFVIKAPEAGMLIYERSWQGKKSAGSQISAWNNTVAELPDLSDMISKTFVNEVDISKIRKGQQVHVKVDAFPEKTFEGKVIQVANIGQELPNRETRVFEVIVQMSLLDSTLRPSMTTSNEILVYESDSSLSIPLESIYRDSADYVLIRENGKLFRKEVIPGFANADRIEIVHGLDSEDEVLLTRIEETQSLDWIPLDAEVKKKIRQEIAEERAKWEAKAKENEAAAKGSYESDNQGGETFIIFN